MTAVEVTVGFVVGAAAGLIFTVAFAAWADLSTWWRNR